MKLVELAHITGDRVLRSLIEPRFPQLRVRIEQQA